MTTVVRSSLKWETHWDDDKTESGCGNVSLIMLTSYAHIYNIICMHNCQLKKFFHIIFILKLCFKAIMQLLKHEQLQTGLFKLSEIGNREWSRIFRFSDVQPEASVMRQLLRWRHQGGWFIFPGKCHHPDKTLVFFFSDFSIFLNCLFRNLTRRKNNDNFIISWKINPWELSHFSLYGVHLLLV